MSNLQMLVLVGMSEVKEASDGRKYFTAEFSSGFGQRPVRRNFWEQYRKDAQGNILSKYWERGTPEQALKLLESGEKIEGSIITHDVQEYEIGERKVSTYTTVVFPGENVEKVFQNANHPILDKATGEVKEKAILSKKSEVSVAAEA